MDRGGFGHGGHRGYRGVGGLYAYGSYCDPYNYPYNCYYGY